MKMNNQQSIYSCDRARIEMYLQDGLGSEDELALMAHLDDCESCRATLKQSAADDRTWGELEKALKDEPDDSMLLSSVVELPDDDPRVENSLQIKHVLSILSPTDDPEMLGRLGPHEISGVIGSGGMGIVLKGHDRSLDRTIAIKVLAPHLATSGAARKRFAREAKAAAAVLHPNVIAIHGVSNDAALPYLVMPYVRGESLQRRLDKQGSLGTAEILRIGQQVASGLAAAHSQGLVHRDIKPANIMLEDGVERVTITDFGLARAVDDATMTRSGVIAGTPQYMSPEQARGEAIDARSDLFSLGSVLFMMCTGHSPFRAETSFGVLHRITHDSPRPIREANPDTPVWLCRLIQRLHEKAADDRLQSAEQVERLILDCIAHCEHPDNCPLPNELSVGQRESRTGKWLIATAAIFAAIMLAMQLPMQLNKPSQSDAKNVGDSSGGPERLHEAVAKTNRPVTASETAWYDSFSPTSLEVKANALRLDAETRLFFQRQETNETPSGTDQ